MLYCCIGQLPLGVTHNAFGSRYPSYTISFLAHRDNDGDDERSQEEGYGEEEADNDADLLGD